MDQPEQQERYGEPRGEQPERYSRDKKKRSRYSFQPADVTEPTATAPFSAVPYISDAPPQRSASLVNAAYPAERLAALRFGAITEMPTRQSDDTPAPLPAPQRQGILQRFSGTGFISLTAAQRQEQRARLVTLTLVAIAGVLVVVSAFLLFNPTVRSPGFGLAPGQRDITKASTAVAILYDTPTVGSSSASQPQGGNTSRPTATATAKPRPTATATPKPTPTTPPAGPSPTLTPTATPRPTATSTPRPTATPTPTWHSVLSQSAPDCNNPPGANWFTADVAATHSACQGGQLMMQQIVTSNDHYAELDVSDNQFSFTHFREQVSVHFITPSDVNTWAILSAQTPQSPTQYSGFNFEMNGNGDWHLHQVLGYTNMPILGQGHISINPAGSTTLMLTEANGSITASINNSPLITWPDTLNPNPGACGLLVRDADFAAVTSSQVLFSNFRYDNWY